jgi:hypothetical protein
MNGFSVRTIRGVGALVLMCLSVTIAAAETATSRIVNAANSFLSRRTRTNQGPADAMPVEGGWVAQPRGTATISRMVSAEEHKGGRNRETTGAPL